MEDHKLAIQPPYVRIFHLHKPLRGAKVMQQARLPCWTRCIACCVPIFTRAVYNKENNLSSHSHTPSAGFQHCAGKLVFCMLMSTLRRSCILPACACMHADHYSEHRETNNNSAAAWSCFLQGGDDWGGRGALVRNIHILLFLLLACGLKIFLGWLMASSIS